MRMEMLYYVHPFSLHFLHGSNQYGGDQKLGVKAKWSVPKCSHSKAD